MQDNKKKGIALLILSAFCFALMSAFVSMSGSLPFFQKALFRNLVSMTAAAATLRKGVSMRIPRGSRLPLLCRSVFGSIGFFCNYYAIDHMILANSNTLSKLSPFFAILFGAIFLRDRATRAQTGCILLALAGSLFIIVPNLQTVGFASLIALLGGMGSGVVHVALRVLRQRDEMSSSAIVFYFSLFSTVIALIPCLAGGWQPMEPRQVLLLLCAGSCCSVAQFSLTNAYRYAPPKDISVYDCSQIIFSGFIGFLIFGQIPSAYSFAGYALIIAASVLLFLCHRREGAAGRKEA